MSEIDFDDSVYLHPFSVVTKQAPNFTAKAVLKDSSIVDIDFHNHIKGKCAVLFFYPLDFTFVCPSEILAFNEAVAKFEERNTAIVGVSVDSQYTHLAWRNTQISDGGIGKINFPLVADITKSIARSYGVLHNEAVALRGLFVIDEKGMVRSAVINDLPIGRNVDEALRVVDAVQFTNAHGEVCPANWSKGTKAMKPTSKGVAEYLDAKFSNKK